MDLELNCFNSKQHHLLLGSAGSREEARTPPLRASEGEKQMAQMLARRGGWRGERALCGELRDCDSSLSSASECP